jgi:hypothetical protein
MTLYILFGFLGSAGLILLLCFGSEIGRIRLRSDISRGGAALGEEAREDWVDDIVEQELRAAGLRKSHPEDEDEFEGVVECCSWLAKFSRT